MPRVLSYFFACFLLRLSFSFGLAFLPFTWFLLLMLPAIPCFFSLCFFISVFTPILLHKIIWAVVDQIMLTGSKGSWAQFVFVCQSHSAKELYYAVDLYSVADLRFVIDICIQKDLKRVLGPIYLHLPKPFCQETVFYDKSVFYCRFLSLALLSLDLSCSLVFLAGLWALLFIGLSSVWVFGYEFAKMGINRSHES